MNKIKGEFRQLTLQREQAERALEIARKIEEKIKQEKQMTNVKTTTERQTKMKTLTIQMEENEIIKDIKESENNKEKEINKNIQDGRHF